MRRAGQRTRCVGAGAGPESARRPAGTAAAHLSVHCPRSRRGPAHRRRRRRDVPRQDRGARDRRGDLRAAAAPLHARLALGGARTESPRDQAPHRAHRRHPVARASAAGVPVPSALPASAQERALPHRAARAAGNHAPPRAPRGVSLRRGADVTAGGGLLLAQTLTNLVISPAGPGLPSGWRLSRIQGVEPPAFEVTRVHTLRMITIAQGGTATYRLRNAIRPPSSLRPGGLTWRWRAGTPLRGADLKRRAGDDSPIRVVITFQDGRTLVYAWGNRESRNELRQKSATSRGRRPNAGIWLCGRKIASASYRAPRATARG